MRYTYSLRTASTIVAICLAAVLRISAQPTPPLQGNWNLTFEDNFDEPTLDGTKWRVGQHFAGITGDGGIDPDQISLVDGNLRITAAEKPTMYSGSSYNYACGELSTFKNFRQKYGYFECRMRYHAVAGMWPAFWLMPDRGNYGWTGKYRRSYLKFDLGGAPSSITHAELRLMPTSVETTTSNHNVLIMKCRDDSWTESGINWNNMPAPDPVFIEQRYANIVVGTPVVVDVTDYIKAEKAGDGVASFTLADTFMRNLLVKFGSRENATSGNRPQLVIDGQVYSPTADAYAQQSVPTTNFGSAVELLVADGYDDASNTYGDGTEIDIMESLGVWGPDHTQHAVHWDGYGSSHKSVESGHLSFPAEGDDFHTYGLYWASGTYEFYIDGVLTYTWTSVEVMESNAFVILSLQLGGWDGNNVGPYLDGRYVEFDYVRVWSGTKTGPATPGGGEGSAPAYTTATASDDAYVRSDSYAGTNFGADVTLASKGSAIAGYSRRTFLKFDVSGLDPDAERIELVLGASQGPSPRDTQLSIRNVPNDSWSENTITWNNQPAYGDLANSRYYAATDVGIVVDVTNIVKAEINGDGIASFRISSATDDAYTTFNSKESTGTAPYLRASPAPAGGGIVLNQADMTSYTTTQDAGTGIVGANGDSVTLSGNVWKKFPYAYTVTPNTVLRVTVDSSDPGEILGIGLDENDTADDALRVVQLGGSQVWSGGYQIGGSLQYVAGSGPYSYDINLGSLFTGPMSYLVFVGDDDANASFQATFSGMELFEAANPPSNVLTIEAESAAGQPAFSPFQVVGNYVVVPNGTGNVNGSSVTEADGILAYPFVLSEATSVTVTMYVDFPSGADDSFWRKMDGGAWVMQNASQASQLTYTYNGLAAGAHTLKIARREDGSAFDRFVITAASGSVSE